MPATITIREASSVEDLETIRTLLREYAEHLNASVGPEHIHMEAYEEELAELPGAYASPKGIILLALVEHQPAGCIALKPLSATRAPASNEAPCEMKRLWVRPRFRGHALGEQLTHALIQHAEQKGYTAIYLDTIPAAMPHANRLYHKLGFQPTEKYVTNSLLTSESARIVHFYRRSLRT